MSVGAVTCTAGRPTAWSTPPPPPPPNASCCCCCWCSCEVWRWLLGCAAGMASLTTLSGGSAAVPAQPSAPVRPAAAAGCCPRGTPASSADIWGILCAIPSCAMSCWMYRWCTSRLCCSCRCTCRQQAGRAHNTRRGSKQHTQHAHVRRVQRVHQVVCLRGKLKGRHARHAQSSDGCARLTTAKMRGHPTHKQEQQARQRTSSCS